jgi:hypothetical protein
MPNLPTGVLVAGAINKLRKWMERHPFRGVEYAGPEADEEEWDSALERREIVAPESVEENEENENA